MKLDAFSAPIFVILVITVRKWNQPKCSSTEEWIMKMFLVVLGDWAQDLTYSLNICSCSSTELYYLQTIKLLSSCSQILKIPWSSKLKLFSFLWEHKWLENNNKKAPIMCTQKSFFQVKRILESKSSMVI